jgi:hypothetical protein
VLLSLACKSKKVAQTTPEVKSQSDSATPIRQMPPMKGNLAAMAQVVIYKTKADYSKNVPVRLSDDKTQIISYPAPSDLLIDGKIQYPKVLSDGFVLDNRGVSLNTAFLKVSYEEYTQPGFLPDPAAMINQVLDADPIVEMYSCGPKSKFQDVVSELNRAIREKKMDGFKKLK